MKTNSYKHALYVEREKCITQSAITFRVKLFKVLANISTYLTKLTASQTLDYLEACRVYFTFIPPVIASDVETLSDMNELLNVLVSKYESDIPF